MRYLLIPLMALAFISCAEQKPGEALQGPPPPPSHGATEPIRLYLGYVQEATGTFASEARINVDKHANNYDIDTHTLGNITGTLPTVWTVNGIQYTVTHEGDFLTITDNTNPSNKVIWKLTLMIAIG